MKTFYVMQGGALEEYLNESSGSASNPPGWENKPCSVLCDTNADDAALQGCDCGEEPVAPIDGGIGIAMILAITLGIIVLFKYKVRN